MDIHSKHLNFLLDIHSKHLNFLFIIYNLSVTDFFALNDAILVRTLRYINDDVAQCAMLAKLKP